MSVEHSTWTIERDYPHPPARVFAAWAEPKLKLRWFDLSASANPNYRSDFRVGGIESFRSPADVHPRFTYDAQYRDIVDQQRIVSTYEMSVDDQRMSVSVATVELLPTAEGTHLVYTEQGAFLDGLDQPASRRSGTTAQLDNLAAVLDATR